MQVPKLTQSFKPLADLVHHSKTGRMLMAAIDLKLFGQFESGPLSSDAVAEMLDLDPIKIVSFLDGLEAMGLLAFKNGKYSPTPLAKEYLCPSSPAYQEGSLKITMDFYDLVYADIPGYLKKGNSASEFMHNLWSGPDHIRSMGQSSLHGSVQDVIVAVTKLEEFDDFTSMCDMAGNHGFYTMALLDLNPKLSGTIIDLPKVLDKAQPLWKEMGYESRISAKPVDLTSDESLGKGYDLLFASHILYSWRETLSDMAARIAESLKPGGYFVSNHSYMPDTHPRPLTPAIMELSAHLAGYPGHYLTESELTEAFAKNGFSSFAANVSEETNAMVFTARYLP